MKKEEITCQLIDFWYIIEFLSQDHFPTETRDNRKKIMLLKKLADSSFIKPAEKKNYDNTYSIIVFHDFPLKQDIDALIREDDKTFTSLPESGTQKHLCIGKLQREFLIKTLYSSMSIEDNRPEEDPGEVCVMGLKVNEEGIYIPGSLSISPILWGTYKCKKANGKMDETIISFDNYNEEVKILEKTINQIEPLDNKNIEKLYNEVYNQYIRPLGDTSLSLFVKGSFIYSRYKDKKKRQKEEDAEMNYSELTKGFYTDDLLMVKQAIAQTPSNRKNGIFDEIMNYITGIHYKNINPDKTDIRNNKEAITQWLSAEKHPLGKWPSKYSPALMQQIAINIAIDESKGHKNIFSVNGPPGTGKTTLLKEIIASNIVNRAKLLCKYSTSDDAFDKKKFEDGPKKDCGYHNFHKYYYTFKNPAITQYGMLVASCNNAAVENITKELPNGKRLLKELKINEETGNIAKGLVEIAECFDRDKNPKEQFLYKRTKKEVIYEEIADIYFSKLAAELMKNKKLPKEPDFIEWGVISAPMGKRKNISNYYEYVLKELIENFLKENIPIEKRKKKYEEAKNEFEKEWQHVSFMRDQICAFMKTSQKYDNLYNIQKLFEQKTIKKNEIQSSHEASQKKLKELENRKELLSSFLVQKEDERKWYEILFSKWIQTERLRQISNLKKELEQINREKEQQRLLSITLEQEKEKITTECKDLESEISCTHKEWKNKRQIFENTLTEINRQFWEDFNSKDEKVNTQIQTITPWIWHAYNRRREKLFYLALQVHKEFILSSKHCRANFINLTMMWKLSENDEGEICTFSERDKKSAYSHLLNTLFLLTPVLSTTFASVGRFLKYIDKQGSLGTLIIDEAGQASPHIALGALWRCQKAIIVGDPKQVEPVVTDDNDAIKYAFTNDLTRPYLNKTISVQEFADRINPYGSYIKNTFSENGDQTWVGCPLVVHRRCINPMFDISNQLSYGGTMKYQTDAPEETVEKNFIETQSYWIDVKGKEKGNKNHFVEEQANITCKLVAKGFERYGNIPNLYIISPFTSVINGIKNKIRNSELLENYNTKEIDTWLNECCGTVHKFQGKEANEVIFLLGCDANAMGAVKWVKANIVNVAVTRAKYRLYVIGDYTVWKKSDIFKGLKDLLEIKTNQ